MAAARLETAALGKSTRDVQESVLKQAGRSVAVNNNNNTLNTINYFMGMCIFKNV